MALATKFMSDYNFVDYLFAIVMGWLLVALWQRFVDNLTYRTLRLDKDSTFHTFMIALVTTCIFLTFVFLFDSILGNIVESSEPGSLNIPAVPDVL